MCKYSTVLREKLSGRMECAWQYAERIAESEPAEANQIIDEATARVGRDLLDLALDLLYAHTDIHYSLVEQDHA